MRLRRCVGHDGPAHFGRASVDLVTSNGETPLHWAASTDAAKTAQLLLDFGVDMERRDSSGSTAILRAVALAALGCWQFYYPEEAKSRQWIMTGAPI